MKLNIEFEFLTSNNINQMLPLMLQINKKTEVSLIEARLKEMFNQNYKCIGILFDKHLIGICGLWFMTRHYSGRSIEIDHVVIDEKYRGQKIGEELIKFITIYAEQNQFEAIELNTYVNNPGSHKFYYNAGFQIKGFHFVKYMI